jgi:hypothetical protein
MGITRSYLSCSSLRKLAHNIRKHKFCSYTPRTIKNILVSVTAAAFMVVEAQAPYFVNPVNVVPYFIGNKFI